MNKIASTAVVLLVLVSGCTYQKAPFLDYAESRGIVLPAPPPDKAQVVFLLYIARTGENLVLYDGEERIVILRYVTWTSRLVEPGPHRFGVVSLENADFTVGDLEGGRTYLLEAQSIFPTYRFRLEPVGPAEKHTNMTIAELAAGFFHVEENAQADAWLARHGPRIQKLYDAYLAKWLTKPVEDRRTITPDLAIEGPIRYLPPSD